MKTTRRGSTNRRQFMKKTAGASLAAAAFPLILPARALGQAGGPSPNTRVRLAIFGCGDRASGSVPELPTMEVVAAVDPYPPRRAKMIERFPGAKPYGDFREALARKDVDAVWIATGDYWHVPLTILAAKAGKHTYTEKPLGLTIEQDKACRDAVKKYGTVFQYGTQQRNMAQYRRAIDLVLSGYIGEVKEAFAWAPIGLTGGDPTPQPVPVGFDYEMWLGPAPDAPFCHDRCFGQGAVKGIFHVYDYAIGYIAGWGSHPLDIVDWWANLAGKGAPVRLEGRGEIPKEGFFNTITQWDIEARFADGTPLHFMSSKEAVTRKVPHISDGKTKMNTHGNTFVGTRGWISVDRNSLASDRDDYRTLMTMPLPDGNSRVGTAVKGGHGADFINAILEKRQPVSDVESACRSDIVSQLGDIAIRLGRPLEWDPKAETIVHDAEAAKRMSRPMRAPWTLAV